MPTTTTDNAPFDRGHDARWAAIIARFSAASADERAHVVRGLAHVHQELLSWARILDTHFGHRQAAEFFQRECDAYCGLMTLWSLSMDESTAEDSPQKRVDNT